jgi:ribosome assembly protein RRB1
MVFVLQAEKASWNSIGIFKVSNISGKRREPVPKLQADDSGMDDEDSDSDDESEDEDGSQGPTLQVSSSSSELLSLCF